MKIKICGMKYSRNILEIGALAPDHMGFIFYPGSKRYAGSHLVGCNLSLLPNSVKTVGVFVNGSVDQIIKTQSKYEFDYLQLHGDESPDFCEKLKSKNISIIKAIQVDNKFNFSTLAPYLGLVDYFLFDTKSENYGGSGKSFNWDVLKNYSFSTPFFLSGGIGIGNIEQALNFNHPKFIALDLNSKLEAAPGLKDPDLCKSIIEKIRNHEKL